jgi:cold shock CspA family protein
MTERLTLTGTVQRLILEKGFGFILAPDGHEYFFHRSSTPDFLMLTEGTAVRFEPHLDAPKGPRAEFVERV